MSCISKRRMAVSCEPSCAASEVHWSSFLKALLSVILLKTFAGMMASEVAIVFSNLNVLVVDKCLVWNVDKPQTGS